MLRSIRETHPGGIRKESNYELFPTGVAAISDQAVPVAKELTPQVTTAVLKRILVAVEKGKRNRWVEITCAVVL